VKIRITKRGQKGWAKFVAVVFDKRQQIKKKSGEKSNVFAG
jgi:hypothetical protein